MKKNDKTKLIDKYVTGNLEDTELWEFKTIIEKDAELAREIKLRKEIFDTISNDKKMELMKTLRKIGVNKQKRVFRINIHSRQVQAFAASIIVLMIVGAGLLSNYIGSGHVSGHDIYTEHFVDEGSLLSVRSDVATDNSSVRSGIRLYKNERYTEAVSLLDSNPENVLARLYCGLSHMKLEQFGMAEKQFQYIIDHRDNIFIDQAEWNLGLSYLAGNKTERANTVFTKIASENGAYGKQASDILRELKDM